MVFFFLDVWWTQKLFYHWVWVESTKTVDTSQRRVVGVAQLKSCTPLLLCMACSGVCLPALTVQCLRVSDGVVLSVVVMWLRKKHTLIASKHKTKFSSVHFHNIDSDTHTHTHADVCPAAEQWGVDQQNRHFLFHSLTSGVPLYISLFALHFLFHILSFIIHPLTLWM